MGGLRTPKRPHPERMCFQCAEWGCACLDWGECRLMAEAVPGPDYRPTYAYSGCAFEMRGGGDAWRPR